MLTWEEIGQALHGEGVLTGGAAVGGISIDSRTIQAGEVFVALRGLHSNGHDYVEDAYARGAGGAVVHARKGLHYAGRFPNVVMVEDTLLALQALATCHRRKFSIPVIAVTGTNGKSTTKEMLAKILGSRGPVLKTQGNQNNHIGVPLTLLRLEARYWAAVVEMGMSGLGEIRRLCEIAEPTLGIITNIGPAHLATLGSLEQVIRAKSELVEALGSEAPVVLNGDDPRLVGLAGRVKGRLLIFRLNGRADLTARGLRTEVGRGVCFDLYLDGESMTVQLPVFGAHNAQNALAAAAAATTLGLGLEEIRAGLEAFEPLSMRLETMEVLGRRVINDAYNANPRSMESAVQTLMDLKGSGRALVVVGDMLELGEFSREAHLEMGAFIARHAVDGLVTLGDMARYVGEGAMAVGMPADRIRHCQDPEEAQQVLLGLSREGDVILVKGSRGMHMERLLAFWLGG